MILLFLSRYHLIYSLNETCLLNNNSEEVINGILKYFFFIINFFTNFFKFNYIFIPFFIYFFYNIILITKIFAILYVKNYIIKNNKLFFDIFYFSKNI